MFHDILKRKNAFLENKNKKTKCRKIAIFPRRLLHAFGQIWQCLHLFILQKIGQENEFHSILQRKNAFLEYKNNKSKKSKNWDFSKGVSPWFW